MIGCGNDRGWGFNGYAGCIDEFAIYAGGLPPNRIRTHYEIWQARDCAEVIRGGGMAGDRDQDCDVDFFDFAELASEWAKCNDPSVGSPDCPKNW